MASKSSQPELKKVKFHELCLLSTNDSQFMDKKLFINLQGGRKVSGTLRGYDLFLNLVIDDALEETTPAQKHPIGTVVIRSSPSRVWHCYISLLNFLEYETLPLDVHQNVLRKCTPPASELRLVLSRRLAVGRIPRDPHPYEGRLQTVIGNIRAMDVVPALDDYHFILEQFAAVGHFSAAMQIFTEILRVGLTPTSKTYGLCFQSIAHRLSLPIPSQTRERINRRCRSMLSFLLDDMAKRKKQFTSVNLDLVLRISKENFDYNGFEAIMKWGYGIDLSNPDCSPLQVQNPDAWNHYPNCPKPLHFSTATLNNTIDILGHMGKTSKMVQAFEVLTAPLPGAQQHMASSFDDDTEEDFGVSSFQSSSWVPPSASPNTTTYNILIRHVCKAGNFVLARHYTLQALRVEHRIQVDTALQLGHFPLSDILSPHLMTNRGTFVPVLGLANRQKHFQLMSWLLKQISGNNGLLERKKQQLAFFTQCRDQMLDGSWQLSPELELPTLPGPGRYRPREEYDFMGRLQIAIRSPWWADRIASLSQKPPLVSMNVVDSHSESPSILPSKVPVFALDVSDESVPEKARVKLFDLELHIQICQRNVNELIVFEEYLQNVTARTAQRIKERLTRRIWTGRDIYFATEKKRVKVPKRHWLNLVNFRPRLGTLSSGNPPARYVNEGARLASNTLPSVFLSHSRFFSPSSVRSQNSIETVVAAVGNSKSEDMTKA
ncbi:hypothetical protein C8J56DRAFT_1003758 [Mycena floridula]|nr:hypothetical protein C8J56DRAFT_1003758 [Mycena floridula]